MRIYFLESTGALFIFVMLVDPLRQGLNRLTLYMVVHLSYHLIALLILDGDPKAWETGRGWGLLNTANDVSFVVDVFV